MAVRGFVSTCFRQVWMSARSSGETRCEGAQAVKNRATRTALRVFMAMLGHLLGSGGPAGSLAVMRARPPPHVAQHEGIRLGHKLGHEYEGLDMRAFWLVISLRMRWVSTLYQAITPPGLRSGPRSFRRGARAQPGARRSVHPRRPSRAARSTRRASR